MVPHPHTWLLEALQMGLVGGGLRARMLQGQGTAGAGTAAGSATSSPRNISLCPASPWAQAAVATLQAALPSGNSHVSHRQQPLLTPEAMVAPRVQTPALVLLAG